MIFKETPSNMASRNIALLKKKYGGEVGSVRIGGTFITNVLKVSENIYVTDKKVDEKYKLLFGMEGSDLHTLISPADEFVFQARLRRFNHAS